MLHHVFVKLSFAGGKKTKENLKFLALKVVAVAYKRFQ